MYSILPIPSSLINFLACCSEKGRWLHRPDRPGCEITCHPELNCDSGGRSCAILFSGDWSCWLLHADSWRFMSGVEDVNHLEIQVKMQLAAVESPFLTGTC